jgi:hypothetical protein
MEIKRERREREDKEVAGRGQRTEILLWETNELIL